MAGYKVLIDRRVWKKDFDPIPRQPLGRITSRIRKLAASPRPTQALKLRGQSGYRIRQGDYRILYEVDDRKMMMIIIRRVAHRKEVYR